MRLNRFVASFSAALFIFSVWPSGLAKPPVVSSLYPAGAQQGSTVEVAADPVPDPWPASAWSGDGAIKLEPINDKKGVYTATIAKDAPLGPHLIRIHNADGASQPRMFFVGLAGEAMEEEPNDSLEVAQHLEAKPVVINGRLDKIGDVDCYSVQAEKGDWIVAQCYAYSVDSPVDAFLHLINENKTKVAFAPDTQNIDPLLVYQVKRAGTFTVTMAGLRFPYNSTPKLQGKTSSNAHSVYRLTLSTGAFAWNTSPLGVQSGKKTPVHLTGWGFEKSGTAQATVVSTATAAGTAWVGAKGLAAPAPVIVGNLAGHRETEPNNSGDSALTIAWPSAVHGQISQADDEDRFGIEVRKGDKLRLRLRASEFDSALDPVLRVEDASGKQLASDDDSGERQDAKLDWTAPADGTYLLAVSDLIRSGSNAHFYRLEVDRITPSLNATFTPDRLVLEAGKNAETTVTISFVDGYEGSPAVVVRGLPEGVSAQIPATEKGGAVKVDFVAAESAKPANVPVSLLVVEPGTAAIHTAISPVGMEKAGGERLLNSVAHLWLTVKPKPKAKSEEKK